MFNNLQVKLQKLDQLGETIQCENMKLSDDPSSSVVDCGIATVAKTPDSSPFGSSLGPSPHNTRELQNTGIWAVSNNGNLQQLPGQYGLKQAQHQKLYHHSKYPSQSSVAPPSFTSTLRSKSPQSGAPVRE